MRPVTLLILDGWGYSSQTLGNAIRSADTPTMDYLDQRYPSILLQASAKAVGLEWGEPGNSEVGHLILGAGRTIYQYSTRINHAIASGEFYKNETLLKAFEHVKTNTSRLHVIGLLGSGTVHSSFSHLISLIEAAQQNGISDVNLHLFTDGKDSGLKEAPQLIEKLEIELKRIGVGHIATVVGRLYAMDRDSNWEKTQVAYEAWTKGIGESSTNLTETIRKKYDEGLNDTTMPPIILDAQGTIQNKDAVIFFNFREDSIQQASKCFVQTEFSHFPRTELSNLFVVLMTRYIQEPNVTLNVIIPPPSIPNGLAEVVSEAGLAQLHIAETQKFAHTTFFFNCLRFEPLPGEKDILEPSLKETHEYPQMRALDIAEAFRDAYAQQDYAFSVINLANADILSHLGNLETTIQGVAAIDKAVSIIKDVVLVHNGILLITADHGNAESLVSKGTGEAETHHNLNPVPCYFIAQEYERYREPEQFNATHQNAVGLISDVAPTILTLLGLPVPAEMTGNSLLSLVN